MEKIQYFSPPAWERPQFPQSPACPTLFFGWTSRKEAHLVNLACSEIRPYLKTNVWLHPISCFSDSALRTCCLCVPKLCFLRIQMLAASVHRLRLNYGAATPGCEVVHHHEERPSSFFHADLFNDHVLSAWTFDPIKTMDWHPYRCTILFCLRYISKHCGKSFSPCALRRRCNIKAKSIVHSRTKLRAHRSSQWKVKQYHLCFYFFANYRQLPHFCDS